MGKVVAAHIEGPYSNTRRFADMAIDHLRIIVDITLSNEGKRMSMKELDSIVSSAATVSQALNELCKHLVRCRKHLVNDDCEHRILTLDTRATGSNASLCECGAVFDITDTVDLMNREG